MHPQGTFTLVIRGAARCSAATIVQQRAAHVWRNSQIRFTRDMRRAKKNEMFDIGGRVKPVIAPVIWF